MNDRWQGLSPPYSTIVADPPWHVEKVVRRTRPNQKTSIGYSTMTLAEIAALPVADLAAATSVLFLWTIDKYLYDAPPIVAAWGFRYHLTMAWDKANGMSLFGFNRRTEFVVVGLRGNHDAYPERPTIRSSFTASAGHRHSQKPDVFFDMLDVLPGPRVELFARAPRLGWDSWGYGYEQAS